MTGHMTWPAKQTENQLLWHLSVPCAHIHTQQLLHCIHSDNSNTEKCTKSRHQTRGGECPSAPL